jgi:hypothetical protein
MPIAVVGGWNPRSMEIATSTKVQANYLGPFLLTRLLECQLQACSARVVNVSSVMHRSSRILDVSKFFNDADHGAC